MYKEAVSKCNSFFNKVDQLTIDNSKHQKSLRELKILKADFF